MTSKSPVRTIGIDSDMCYRVRPRLGRWHRFEI
ncbi:hypothetical protein F383_36015 [Gossypium arboreum]|uniref:Uncharacterized protein n=1 Tax=Gossypium arboreum TaxID=29729 RepID=A0A0B0PYR2_GOSAR|nr:hypothetical protein F383_36015 [Gossypium arboreum]